MSQFPSLESIVDLIDTLGNISSRHLGDSDWDTQVLKPLLLCSLPLIAVSSDHLNLSQLTRTFRAIRVFPLAWTSRRRQIRDLNVNSLSGDAEVEEKMNSSVSAEIVVCDDDSSLSGDDDTLNNNGLEDQPEDESDYCSALIFMGFDNKTSLNVQFDDASEMFCKIWDIWMKCVTLTIDRLIHRTEYLLLNLEELNQRTLLSILFSLVSLTLPYIISNYYADIY